jgi:hypothetical protein
MYSILGGKKNNLNNDIQVFRPFIPIYNFQFGEVTKTFVYLLNKGGIALREVLYTKKNVFI